MPSLRLEALEERALPSAGSIFSIPAPISAGTAAVTGTSNVPAVADAVAFQVVNGSTKILVAGYDTVNGNQDFAIWRFNSDGTLDTSFGQGGEVTADFGAGLGFDFAEAKTLAVDPATGDIVVAGYAFNATTSSLDFALAVLNPDGTLDSQFGAGSGSFGPAGTVTTDFGSGDAQINGLAIDPSTHQIVVAGYAFNATTSNGDFALARYNFDGSLDSTFGAGTGSFGPAGTVTTDFGSNAQANALTIDSAGHYVLGGYANNPATFNNDFAIARYNADGSLDGTFGAGSGSFGPAGTVTTDFGSGDAMINALAIDANGQYVAAGDAFNSTTGNTDLALARYNLDGNIDPTFGAGSGSVGPAGTVTTDFSSGSTQANALAIGANNQYVVGGFAYDSATGNTDFAIARYNADGSLDGNFGANTGSIGPAGTMSIDFGSGGYAQINGLAIDGNGAYVAAGYALGGASFSPSVALARLNSTGSSDSAFGANTGSFGPAGTVTWQSFSTVPGQPGTGGGSGGGSGGGGVFPPVPQGSVGPQFGAVSGSAGAPGFGGLAFAAAATASQGGSVTLSATGSSILPVNGLSANSAVPSGTEAASGSGTGGSSSALAGGSSSVIGLGRTYAPHTTDSGTSQTPDDGTTDAPSPSGKGDLEQSPSLPPASSPDETGADDTDSLDAREETEGSFTVSSESLS